MNLTTMNTKPLTLPRRLAMLLLHEAQIADGPLDALVVADPGAAEPDARVKLPGAGQIDSSAASLETVGRVPWAHFLFRPDRLPPPALADFEPRPALLRLTASLETKGVLKLRGWSLVDGAVVERELRIRD